MVMKYNARELESGGNTIKLHLGEPTSKTDFHYHKYGSSLLKKRPHHRLVGRRPNGRSSHQQPKVFRCPLESCGKVFQDRASLKKHNTVHGDKLF